MTSASISQLIMPALPQTIALCVGSIAVAALLVIAIFHSRRYRSIVPVLLLPAGFCTVALEPIVGLLGHGVHPVIGQMARCTYCSTRN
jgi:hypothetical protein